MITRHFAIRGYVAGHHPAARTRSGNAARVRRPMRSRSTADWCPTTSSFSLIEDWLNLHGENGFVFDGFPRTVHAGGAVERDSAKAQQRRSTSPFGWRFPKRRCAIGSPAGCNAERCGFTTSLTSARFAERPICPYCDGPLIRREDDDASVLQTRLRGIQDQDRAAPFLLRKRCTPSIASTAIAIEKRSLADIRALIEENACDDSDQSRPGNRAKCGCACRTASDVLERVSELIRPGFRPKEIDQAAADLDAGCRSAKCASSGIGLAIAVFPGNICISLNDEIVHGIGSQRRIQYGDIVKLDIGVVQDGWVGDTAATVPVGMIDERIEKLLAVTESALQRAIDSCHCRRAPGRSLRGDRGRSDCAIISAW